MATKPILISAGHSDTDPGAVSRDGIKESDLAERLRNRIVALLRERNIHCVSDGEGTVNKPLNDAVKLARANPGGVLLEIHFNAGPPTARGVEALSYPKDLELSIDLCKAIAARTGSPLRGREGWKNPSSGQHHRLAFCEAGGLILEVEFMSSVEGLRAYLTHESEIARDLAQVIAKHAGYTWDVDA